MANMSTANDFLTWQVPALKGYLQQRGISCSLGRRMDLIRLATLAEEMNLEVLTSTDDYEMMDEARRTVGKDAVVLPSVTAVSKWSKDLRSLPDIEHCDILIYFMRKCEWTNDRLKLYKHDNGYQLYTANHIGDVELAIVDTSPDHDCMYVSATCVPETRQTAAPYKVWILMNARTAEILSGGCTCVVDNGTCKHCVALLFSLSSFCSRHKDRSTEVCTDVECVWDKPRKTSEPMEIENIDIRYDPSKSAPYLPTRNNYTPHLNRTSQREVEKELYDMCKGTNGLLLQILDPPSDESEDEAPLKPPTMLDVASQHTAENDGMSFVDQLSVSFDSRTITDIEESTRGQGKEWMEHRKGRITASNFSSVLNFRFPDKPDNYILKKVMGQSDIRAKSTEFGKDYEPVARQQYTELYSKSHQHSNIEICGLFIDEEHPYMGASPDGVVSCKCCGKGLLEIKCSFSYQNKSGKDACKDPDYHVYLDENDDVRLKISSPWYTQIQGQMGVCKREWCDFVFFTKKDLCVDRIYFDPDFFQRIVDKSAKFFEKYVVKALLDS